jgi:hypothetical protein
MVINFGVKNRVVALWNSLFEASVQKARNGPSTKLIEATSCVDVEKSNATIKAKLQINRRVRSPDITWWLTISATWRCNFLKRN